MLVVRSSNLLHCMVLLRRKKSPLVKFDKRAATAYSFYTNRVISLAHSNTVPKKKSTRTNTTINNTSSANCVFFLSFPLFVAKSVGSCNKRSLAWFSPSHGLCGVRCCRCREPLSLLKVKASLNHTIRSFQHAAEIYRMDFDFDRTHFQELSLSVFVCACVYSHASV